MEKEEREGFEYNDLLGGDLGGGVLMVCTVLTLGTTKFEVASDLLDGLKVELYLG